MSKDGGIELEDRQKALLCQALRGGRRATVAQRLLEEDDDTIARLRKLKYQTHSHRMKYNLNNLWTEAMLSPLHIVGGYSRLGRCLEILPSQIARYDSKSRHAVSQVYWVAIAPLCLY